MMRGELDRFQRYTPSLKTLPTVWPITHDGHTNGTGMRVSVRGNCRGASVAVAHRPRSRTPRPISGPCDRQSIHPIVNDQNAADSLSASRYASMFATRIRSLQIHGDGTRDS